MGRAKREEGAAVWVALELRVDRVYQGWSRMVMEGVRNLALVGGDAAGLETTVARWRVDGLEAALPAIAEPDAAHCASTAAGSWSAGMATRYW